MHSTLTRAHTCARVPIKPHPSLCQEKGLRHGSSEITAFWSPTPGSHSEHQSLSNSKGSLATEPGCEPRVPNGSRFHNRPLHHSPPGSCQHPQEPPGPAVVRSSPRPQQQLPAQRSSAQPAFPATSFHLLKHDPPKAASQHFHKIWVLSLIPFLNCNFPRGSCQSNVDFVGFYFFFFFQKKIELWGQHL